MWSTIDELDLKLSVELVLLAIDFLIFFWDIIGSFTKSDCWILWVKIDFLASLSFYFTYFSYCCEKDGRSIYF